MIRLLDAALPNSRRAAGRARRMIEDIQPSLPEPILADVALIVSELVTNSHRYGGLDAGDLIRVTLSREGSTLRGEIVDPGKGATVPAARTPTPNGGWGLEIVDRQTTRWGVERARGATVVWFEIDVEGRSHD